MDFFQSMTLRMDVVTSSEKYENETSLWDSLCALRFPVRRDRFRMTWFSWPLMNRSLQQKIRTTCRNKDDKVIIEANRRIRNTLIFSLLYQKKKSEKKNKLSSIFNQYKSSIETMRALMKSCRNTYIYIYIYMYTCIHIYIYMYFKYKFHARSVHDISMTYSSLIDQDLIRDDIMICRYIRHTLCKFHMIKNELIIYASDFMMSRMISSCKSRLTVDISTLYFSNLTKVGDDPHWWWISEPSRLDDTYHFFESRILCKRSHLFTKYIDRYLTHSKMFYAYRNYFLFLVSLDSQDRLHPRTKILNANHFAILWYIIHLLFQRLEHKLLHTLRIGSWVDLNTTDTLYDLKMFLMSIQHIRFWN